MSDEAAKALPSITVNLGGVDRTLVCSMFVLWKFQASTGKNPFELNLKQMSPEDMVTLLWAAIIQNEPDITKEQVAMMMGAMHLRDLGKLITNLFAVASPSPDPDAEPSTADTKKN